MKESLGVSEIKLLLANKKSKKHKYEPINESIKIEGIEEPIETIFSNIREVLFRSTKKNKQKSLAIIEITRKSVGLIKANEFKINGNVIIINKRKYIGNLISSALKIKGLFKIEMCFYRNKTYL